MTVHSVARGATFLHVFQPRPYKIQKMLPQPIQSKGKGKPSKVTKDHLEPKWGPGCFDWREKALFFEGFFPSKIGRSWLGSRHPWESNQVQGVVNEPPGDPKSRRPLLLGHLDVPDRKLGSKVILWHQYTPVISRLQPIYQPWILTSWDIQVGGVDLKGVDFYVLPLMV